MFKYKSAKQQLIEQKRKNEMLESLLQRQRADIDYIAMMSEVELEIEETEAEEYEQV